MRNSAGLFPLLCDASGIQKSKMMVHSDFEILQTCSRFDFSFNPYMLPEVGECLYIRKPIFAFLFDFYRHHLSTSYHFCDNWLQIFEGLISDL